MKLKSILLRFIFVNVSLLFSLFTYAQENETELKSRADKSFRAENYVEASKLYAQLLSFNRDDVFYNFRYGVCLIYNSRKKVDAIKHLTYASKAANTDPEVFFYLGKAYHLNYEFGEALRYYNEYKNKAGNKLNVTLDVNRQIEMSENGKRLLTSANEVVVLEKKEIESQSFFRVYDLKDIGGDILVNAQFQSKLDKKYKHTPIIHFPAKPSMIYYSSYGENEGNGKDIFIRRRLPDGSWSLPQTLNGGVNTKFDEDFPYMHPNGEYLYFCSKGHNSMGGYDVFRSKFDKEKNIFGPAENLDFAISSPDDDLFYVVDSLDRNAYFASARQSLDGKIHVYKVRVAQVPIQIAVIKASFSSTIRPENKKVSVEIFDFASNTKIGTFNATEKGNVLMTFPKGGKYEYQIKVDGVATVFKSVVNVPFLTEFKPLKQKMVHEKTEQGEVVNIVNLFDENVEDPVATLSEIARIRSELNPNADQFDLKKLDNSSENKQLYAELGYGKQGDREVQENIEKLAQNQEKQVEALKETQQKAVDKVIDNANTIKNLQADLKATVAQAETKTGDDKKVLFAKAAAIVNKLNQIDKENKSLLVFADSIAAPISEKLKEAQKARKVSDELKKAFTEKNTALMGQKLAENKEFIKEVQKDTEDPLVKDILAKKEEIKKISAKQKEYLDMKIKAKNDLLDLDVKRAEAKSKDIPIIDKKIQDKQEEIKMIDEELKSVDPKLITKKEELKKVEDKLAAYQAIQALKAPVTKSSSSDASKALASVDNPNSRTLRSYVEEQSKQFGIDLAAQKLEEKNTVASSDDKKSTSAKKLEKVQLSETQKEISKQLSPDYFKNKEAILNDGQLPEDQKLKLGQREDKNMKFLLAREIGAVKESLSQNPNDESLKKKLKSLEDFNEVLTNNVEVVQRELEQKFPAIYPEKRITDKQLANRVKPNHFAVLSTLETNTEMSENQRLDKTQREDQEFIRLLTLEKNKLQTILMKDPSDEIVAHELNLIKDLTKETEARMERRTLGMASLQIPDKKEVDSYVPKTTEDKKGEELAKNEDKKLVKSNPEENKTSESKQNQEEVRDPKVTQNNSPEKLPVENSKENKTQENLVTENKKTNEVKDPVNEPKNEVKTEENKQKTSDVVAENKTDEKQIAASNSLPVDYEAIKKVSPTYEKNTAGIKNNSLSSVQEKNQKLILEENKLQKAADIKLSKIEQDLQKKPADTTLLRQKEELLALKTQSEDRENESKQLVINEIKEDIKKEQLIASIDKTYAQDSKTQTTSVNAQREEDFQKKVQARIAANDKRIALNENFALEAENQVLNELIDESKGKVASVSNPQLATNDTQNQVKTEQVKVSEQLSSQQKMEAKTAQMVHLKQQEDSIQTQLSAPKLTKEQEKKLYLQLAENQEKQLAMVSESSETQSKFVALQQQQAKPARSKQDQTITLSDSIALSMGQQNELEIAKLLKELSKTKKEQKRVELLREIKDKQTENSAIYEDYAYSKQMTNDVVQLQSLESKATSLSLESKVSLSERKQKIKQQQDQLKAQIEHDKMALKEAKSDEKLLLAKRIVANEKRLDLLKDEYKAVDFEEKNRSTEEGKNKTPMLAKAAYSEEEKKNLSALNNYTELKAAFEASQRATENKIQAYNDLETAKSKYAQAVAQQAKNPSAENQQAVKEALNLVISQTKNYKEAQDNYNSAQKSYQDLAKNQTELAKLEALFQDGVEANYVASNKTPEEIAEKETVPFRIFDTPQSEAATERIKIDETMPMGLVYRVQVGAFRNPLKSKMYAEFTPVSGEPIKAGITRYITGYFGSILTASEAKREIRRLGYRDAFIVAYCDGKRISISKARKLQASGQCVPNAELDTKVELANNKTKEDQKNNPQEHKTASNDNKSKEKQTEVKSEAKSEKTKINTDYNKAPGAVQAIPVETKLGLFYTVQIGAYRKPATAKQLKYVENVVSKLLSDGMIRYSTGIFPSVEAAIPTKNAAISKGVNDAFVTAYYNGERITLAEAERLLKEKGEGILEKP